MDLTPREWSALMTAVSMLLGTLWYLPQIFQGTKVKPVFASWLVSGCTLSVSYLTYWTIPGASFIGSVANLVTAISAATILLALMVQNLLGGEKIIFNRFQKFWLAASALIAAYWLHLVAEGDTGKLPNALIQTIVFISYLITAQKLWSATKNTESFILWGSICVSGLFGLYTAWQLSDAWAAVYAGRSALCSGGLVFLMLRIERRSKQIDSK